MTESNDFFISIQYIFDTICWFCNLAWFLILVSLIFDPISFIDFWYNHILLHRNLSICEPFIKILKNRHGCRWSLTSKKPKYVHADKLQKLDKQVLTESLNWCPLLTRCLRGASAMLTRSYVHKLLFFLANNFDWCLWTDSLAKMN